MLNKSLQREFENGLPGPLYFIWSNESIFLDEALSRFTETVIASNPVEFNYDVYDSSSDMQKIVDAASTLPFVATRRLVAIKNFHEFTASNIKAVKPYLMKPCESTCMVILSRKAPKASMKFNWKVYSLSIKANDFPVWLRNTASRKGIRLTDDAVDYLLEFLGYDTGLLMMEIEKMKLSGSKTVTGKDIISSTIMLREYNPFDLLDALISGQRTRAFRILKTMLSASAMDAPVILGTLNWHYKQFYSLWKNKGKRPVRMREKTFRTLVKYIPSFSEGDFCNIFQNLHEADLGIKMSGRPEIVLELLLIKLLQKGAWN